MPQLEVELTIIQAMELLNLTVDLFLSLILIGLVWLNHLQWEVSGLHSHTTLLLDNLGQLAVHKMIFGLQEHPCFRQVLFLPHMVCLIKFQWRDLHTRIFLPICSILEEMPPLIPGTTDCSISINEVLISSMWG